MDYEADDLVRLRNQKPRKKRWWPGVGNDLPLQRWIDAEPGYKVEVRLTLTMADGMESPPSNAGCVCWPHVWTVGEPYPGGDPCG